MAGKKKITSASEVLRRRYIGDDPERKASIEAERVNAHVARMIYDLRGDAGLSQKELAELIGTTQSVISRLESADYEGHSLSMLNRIAKALNKKLTVVMAAEDPRAAELCYAFQVAVRNLRKAEGLTAAELAKRTGVDQDEIMAMERSTGYRPTPLALHKLSRFYDIPERRLAALAGAFREPPSDIVESASRFAAQSESFAKLTKQEKKVLDEFVKLLKSKE
ncbi:MAG: XRE family transcriptional regulator [Planctomycetes bacterium]|nr:XRE family transcriptional regulator [Planctomycetota bacterium]